MNPKIYMAVCIYDAMGEVVETDYNDEQEVEVNWFVEEQYTMTSRTSEKYLKKIKRIELVEVGEDGLIPDNFVIIGYVSTDAIWVKNGDKFWEDEIKLIPNSLPEKHPIFYRIEIKNKYCGHFH